MVVPLPEAAKGDCHFFLNVPEWPTSGTPSENILTKSDLILLSRDRKNQMMVTFAAASSVAVCTAAASVSGFLPCKALLNPAQRARRRRRRT